MDRKFVEPSAECGLDLGEQEVREQEVTTYHRHNNWRG